jgi:hypothetical protein
MAAMKQGNGAGQVSAIEPTRDDADKQAQWYRLIAQISPLGATISASFADGRVAVGCRWGSLQCAKAVNDPRQSIDQHGQNGADAGQQEYRRDSQLDNVGDSGDACCLHKVALQKNAGLVAGLIQPDWRISTLLNPRSDLSLRRRVSVRALAMVNRRKACS